MVKFHYMGEAQLRQWVEANPGRVNDRDEEGDTPLYAAAKSKQWLSLVVWLLDEKGVDVNATTSDGTTALHRARSLDILNALQDRGADPTLQDRCGWSPLMQQAWYGNVDSVARMLRDPRVRATINIKNWFGHTALHRACFCDNERPRLRIFHLLLQAGADAATTDRRGLAPLADLRQYLLSDHAVIALLEQAPDAEKASLLVKVRRFVIVATASSTTRAPSYAHRRIAQGQPLPHVALALLMDEENDEDEEERRKLCTMLTFVSGMGGGWEGGGMPRDVFQVFMDFIMPSWDPLRRGISGTGPTVQG